MKKFIGILLVLIFASIAMAEVPVSIGTQVETGNLFSADPFSLENDLNVEATFGDSGFLAGLDVYTPFLPEFSAARAIDLYEEYDFTLADKFDFAITNTNSIYLSDITFDGYLDLDATYSFVNAGFDLYYLPEFTADFYVGPTWSKEFAFGTVDLSATAYLNLYPEFSLGDIGGEAKLTVPVSNVDLSLGLKPTFNEGTNGREFGGSVYLGAAINL